MKLLSEETDQGLIDKWKRVLDFEGEYVPKIDESDRLRVAKAMNDMEKYIDTQIPFESRSILARVLIPLIRRTLQDFNRTDVWRIFIKTTPPLGEEVCDNVSFWVVDMKKDDYIWFSNRFHYHPSLKEPQLGDTVKVYIALEDRLWCMGDMAHMARGFDRGFGAYTEEEFKKIDYRDSVEHRDHLLQKWGPLLSSTPLSSNDKRAMLIPPQESWSPEENVDISSE